MNFFQTFRGRLLLILTFTLGNMALGFALACLFGHGPKLPELPVHKLRELADFSGPVGQWPALALAFIRSRRSPRSRP